MKASLLILLVVSGFTAFGQSSTAAQSLPGGTNALYSASTVNTDLHHYLVKSGDTDVSIARKFGMTRKALQSANPDIPMARLKVGQALVIPAEHWVETNAVSKSGSQASSQPKPTLLTTPYVVSRGDTTKKIAKKHGISVSALLAANPVLDPARLKVGQTLAIPPKPVRPSAKPKKD